MTRKNTLILAVALVALAAVYWNLYRDAFRKKVIQISYTVRARNGNARRRAAAAPATLQDEPAMTLNFGLDRKYKLTGVKVIPQEEVLTNKYPHPIWEMVSESNTPPTMAFIYGDRIRGLHPAVKGAEPEPLQMGVTYHIFVDAGKLHGEHVFTLGEPQTNTAPPETSGN